MKWFTWFLVGMIGVFLSGFLGCGLSSDSNRSAVSDEECLCKRSFQNSQQGGRIIQGMLGEPVNLIPPLATDAGSHEIANLIYVALLKYDKDVILRPWAAESVEVEEEGKLLRFTLKKGIKWFDGREVTAEDVEFTYRLMIDPETPTVYSEDYKAVSSFRVLDRYRFEVRYEQPFARALVTWANHILPKHVLENENLTQTPYSRTPVGAGAYKVKEWESGRRIVLTANEEYFEGRANIDEVIIRFIPDSATMFLELKSGNLDMMELTPLQYLFQASGLKWECEYNKYSYLDFAYTYLGYNLKHPLFASRKVRQALSYAIDKEELVKGVLLGKGTIALGPYKPGTWMYNNALQPYGYKPKRALRLLQEEGWKDTDKDGVLDKNGRSFSFTILTNQGNTLRIKAATIIQQRLKHIGIAVSIRTVEWATFLNEFIHTGRFEATILGWNIPQDPDIFDVWHSSKIEDGLNFIGYADDEVDRLLEEGRRTLKRSKRKKMYDRVQEILHRDQPYTFLWAPEALPIVDCRFQGVETSTLGIKHNFIHWWVPAGHQSNISIQ